MKKFIIGIDFSKETVDALSLQQLSGAAANLQTLLNKTL